jgi:hypothetical protein
MEAAAGLSSRLIPTRIAGWGPLPPAQLRSMFTDQVKDLTRRTVTAIYRVMQKENASFPHPGSALITQWHIGGIGVTVRLHM